MSLTGIPDIKGRSRRGGEDVQWRSKKVTGLGTWSNCDGEGKTGNS